MNSLTSLRMVLFAVPLLFAGCAIFDSSDKPAPTPSTPPEQVSKPVEITPPPQEVAVEKPEVSPQEEPEEEIIPIKDLPTKKGYPYAIKTKWPGYVKSPYAQDKQLVDVRSWASGTAVRCPHTGKIFIVP